MSLIRFLGSELVTALGRLDETHVLGNWSGGRPADRRRKMKFAPVLYGDDHAHWFSELCLLIEGRCRFSFDHVSTVLEAGDLVVCPAGVPHAEAYCRPGEAYRLVWWNLNEDPGLHVTSYTRRAGFTIEHMMSLASLPADSRARLERLRAIAVSNRAPSIDEVRESMLTVALTLYRRALESGEEKLDTRAQLVRRATEFIREHAERPLSLGDVARAVRVSPNYLTSLFRAETGTPLGRFILVERIARAQKKLSSPDASVKAVALELGFADPFSFSRAFKRVTGRAPRAALRK